MYWRLTPNLTACIAADRVLFLDVARDRYFAAPPAINDEFASWLCSGNTIGAFSRSRSLLVDLAMLDPEDAEHIAPKACHVAMPAPLDAQSLPLSRIGPGTIAGVGRAVIRARRDVKNGPLASILAHRLSPAQYVSNREDADRRVRLAAFRTARPLIPVPRVCLHDCLALVDWLGPARAGTQLVFGVAAFPFAAHSWLQADGRVIDDHPESASRFQPILHFP